jgi:hypothetical protein
MKEELKHIFDHSACMTRRQMVDYLDGQMALEECHAVEHHINGCPLCSTAMDAVLNNRDSLHTIETLNTVFLKEHFHLITPEIHLNSLTAASSANKKTTKQKIHPLWYLGAAIAGTAAICYFKNKGGI